MTAVYYSLSQSEVVNYGDLFPNFDRRTVFSTPLSCHLALTPVIGHNTACQNDDYVVKIRL